MANLKSIRRRIGSVRSTQKITRAMKMVAAARLRRSQEAVQAFRPYANTIASMLAEVASEQEEVTHPLLASGEDKKSLVLTFSADRGLCGGFNANLCRAVSNHVIETEADKEHDVKLMIIGRKANEYFERRPVQIEDYLDGIYNDISYASAAEIARDLAGRYARGEVDRIDLYFNEFISMVSQKPVLRQLLPVALPERKVEESHDDLGVELKPVGFIFEPTREQLLNELLPRYVEVQVYRAFLESLAAEHAARMTAMDAATNNAEDMLGQLTLEYNRARQSAITNDLMDIVGGAEALRE